MDPDEAGGSGSHDRSAPPPSGPPPAKRSNKGKEKMTDSDVAEETRKQKELLDESLGEATFEAFRTWRLSEKPGFDEWVKGRLLDHVPEDVGLEYVHHTIPYYKNADDPDYTPQDDVYESLPYAATGTLVAWEPDDYADAPWDAMHLPTEYRERVYTAHSRTVADWIRIQGIEGDYGLRDLWESVHIPMEYLDD